MKPGDSDPLRKSLQPYYNQGHRDGPIVVEYKRLIPTSWDVFPNALSTALQYLSLQLPENTLMIFVTGFVGNVNHMTLGTNTTSWWGVVRYLAWMAVVVGFWLVASPLTIKHPRRIQKAGQAMVGRLKGLLERTNPTATYSESDISPYFWTNGEKPESDEYRRLKAGNWSEYRLHIDGLVGSPRELSYADLLALPRQDQITQHFCIQGWSGGPMRVICEFVDVARADTTRIRSSTATACRFKGASIS